MKALHLDAVQDVGISEVARPTVGAHDVRVRVRACGLCGSDLSVYLGQHPFRKAPVVLGHEVAGEVTEVGSGVDAVALGDRVAIEPQIACGRCAACTAGHGNVCANKGVVGVDFPGLLSEEVAVPDSIVYPLAGDIDWAIGAMAEPLAVACRAVRAFGDCLGRRVAVLGVGAIGALVALLARHGGATRLLVTDVRQPNLDAVAAATGATTINVGGGSARDAGSALTDGQGFDAVFVAAGAPVVLRDAQALCRKGGMIVAIALFAEPVPVDMDALVTGELTLRGSSMYTPDDFGAAVAFINSGALDVEALISHRIGLDEAPAMVRDMVDGTDHLKVTVLL
ncbi:MAG: alcohol dehydrogenase catalytic domain-containing protein [Solirubrobacterales bacterium]|nr:alcohol dehydrogenase catalytic domain-containing protein [Solirubrobacterales bacterium]